MVLFAKTVSGRLDPTQKLILIMVHIFNRLRNNLFNYTTCFDANGSSSGVFGYTSFTIELQREIHTFLLCNSIVKVV
jgi:hypothetical protein